MNESDKMLKAKDRIKELLYIEIIHQQMETFINIDKMLDKPKTSGIEAKTQPS